MPMKTMRAIVHHLTDRQLEALDDLAQRSGLRRAELLRRAVDLFLQTRETIDEREPRKIPGEKK